MRVLVAVLKWGQELTSYLLLLEYLIIEYTSTDFLVYYLSFASLLYLSTSSYSDPYFMELIISMIWRSRKSRVNKIIYKTAKDVFSLWRARIF